MAIGFLLGKVPDVGYVHDTYAATNHSVVSFVCGGKKRAVRALLSDAIDLTVLSSWKSLFNGGVGQIGSQVVGIIENLRQLFGGTSIRQPWFGRKLWEGTAPLHFDLPIQFLSYNDAYQEVYLPAIGLLSFLYPRLDGREGEDKLWKKYFVPGPSLDYEVDNHGDGDRVEINLGNFIKFTGCYLTAVSLNIANSFNLDGYPHNIRARVSFDAMDVSFVESDGAFMQGGFENQAIKIGEIVRDFFGFGKNIMDKVDEYSEAISGGVRRFGTEVKNLLQ
jgi:hypothetical protein